MGLKQTTVGPNDRQTKRPSNQTTVGPNDRRAKRLSDQTTMLDQKLLVLLLWTCSGPGQSSVVWKSHWYNSGHRTWQDADKICRRPGLKRQRETTIKHQVHQPQEGLGSGLSVLGGGQGKVSGRPKPWNIRSLVRKEPELVQESVQPSEREGRSLHLQASPRDQTTAERLAPPSLVIDLQYSGSLATVIKESDIKDLDLKKFQAWIGLFKEGSDWRWVDGISTEYNISEVFAPGEPGGGEDCARAVYKNKAFGIGCGAKFFIFCEGGSPYIEFIPVSKTWSDGKQLCEDKGWKYLDFITSYELAQWSSILSEERDHPVWIGLHSDGEAWKWSNGASSDYRKWAGGSDPGPVHGSDSCVVVSSQTKTMSRQLVLLEEKMSWEQALEACGNISSKHKYVLLCSESLRNEASPTKAPKHPRPKIQNIPDQRSKTSPTKDPKHPRPKIQNILDQRSKTSSTKDPKHPRPKIQNILDQRCKTSRTMIQDIPDQRSKTSPTKAPKHPRTMIQDNLDQSSKTSSTKDPKHPRPKLQNIPDQRSKTSSTKDPKHPRPKIQNILDQRSKTSLTKAPKHPRPKIQDIPDQSSKTPSTKAPKHPDQRSKTSSTKAPKHPRPKNQNILDQRSKTSPTKAPKHPRPKLQNILDQRSKTSPTKDPKHPRPKIQNILNQSSKNILDQSSKSSSTKAPKHPRPKIQNILDQSSKTSLTKAPKHPRPKLQNILDQRSKTSSTKAPKHRRPTIQDIPDQSSKTPSTKAPKHPRPRSKTSSTKDPKHPRPKIQNILDQSFKTSSSKAANILDQRSKTSPTKAPKHPRPKLQNILDQRSKTSSTKDPKHPRPKIQDILDQRSKTSSTKAPKHPRAKLQNILDQSSKTSSTKDPNILDQSSKTSSTKAPKHPRPKIPDNRDCQKPDGNQSKETHRRIRSSGSGPGPVQQCVSHMNVVEASDWEPLNLKHISPYRLFSGTARELEYNVGRFQQTNKVWVGLRFLGGSWFWSDGALSLCLFLSVLSLDFTVELWSWTDLQDQTS
ncbi:hypothetical protein WMY93_012828 [Mugilogobius chulae]|uniref:C-type lectin domain-containing protein n=1 Tax=Mugilogobius chulae TaxID=88201 RepID=A0AAW0P7E5_9GOBI